ncbi:hypothetical protein [Blastococcus sp. URHD0036]|uniref:hypothetical protein n=1 Tax=Blastococcus sp. URHD0036 TaxID=1380356 RepID=UPI0012DF782E|nr:hypothetical protein [Blastococcus sp. URHD0036]
MSENDPGPTSDAEDGGSALDLPTRDSDDSPDESTSIATTSVEEALAEGEHLR